ncbi:MAG: hypothetical protein HGA19_20865, partial [Oscillochloris sp.]|nr:hypothetical protein [Oscillochloris sp.]
MTVPTTTVASRNAPGPSLIKLVSHIPTERRWRRQADALIVIGRQLELMAQEQGRTAHVSLGTIRFSLFRMHQGRINQIAPHCRSITVYGEADIAPPEIPGVNFVAVPHGAPMSQEWFLVIDSPTFWGAMIAQASAEHGDTGRRYLFDGVLTSDERVASRASLLLSLASGRANTDIGERNPIANRMHWGKIAYALMHHAEAQRLDMRQCISDLPEMQALLATPGQSLSKIAPEVLDVLRRYCGTLGEIIYRAEGDALVPLTWSCPQRPPEQPVGIGVIGQALIQGQPVITMLQPNDLERVLLSEANSVAAIPLIIKGLAWGVLLVGQPEYDPEGAPTSIAAAGIAALLAQMIEADPAAIALPITPHASDTSLRPSVPPAPPTIPPAHGFGGPGPIQPPPSFVPPSPAPQTHYAPQNPTQTPGWPAAQSHAPSNVSPPTGRSSSFGMPAWMRNSSRAGGNPVPPPTPPMGGVPQPNENQNLRSWPVLQQRLLSALVAYDQQTAEQVWSETCAIYTPEQICNELLTPIQVTIGDGWHRGEISVAAEHFSSRFVQSKLLNLFNASTNHTSGPMAIVACAQGELHEIGAIMISLFLRWGGFHVVYLG